MELYNDNCFDVFPFINDKSIDLFVLDLPYGQTACKWDTCIDLNKMWIEIKRMMKPNAVILFYCTTKFGYKLIQSNEKWFRYDLIWKKSKKVGFLSCNRAPLRQHENVYIFSDNHITYSKNGKYGTYNPQKSEGEPYKVKGGKSKNVDGSLSRGHEVYSKEYENKGDRHPTSIIEHENVYIFSGLNEDNQELKLYAKKVLDFIGKSKTKINKELGHRQAEHFFYWKPEVNQFLVPTEKVYNELIKLYKINEMEGFIDYKNLDSKSKYNPQKTKGKPYKSKERVEGEGVYIKDSYKRTATKDTTNRHPTSIIEHENVYIFKDKGGTYNPQKTKGKPYIATRKECNIYSNDIENKPTINKGDRHPTSIYPDTIETTILEHNNPHKSVHRTQKPTSLCEWLIKTYSNEEDTVMDFTMGSGTTGEACLNTNRKFIGIEMDPEIFEIAEKRLDVKVI